MKIKLLLRNFLMSVFMIISVPSLAQSVTTPLYIVSDPEDFGPEGRKRMAMSDIKHVRMIYHHEIDPDNDGQVNYDVLRSAINLKVPNKLEAGYCLLDWEGLQFEYLKFSAIDEDSMNAIVNKFLDMLAYARSLRPLAKWGVYDMPVTTYWVNQDTTWAKRAAIITPLIKQCDVLAPCLYDYFQTGSYEWMNDDAYINITIRRSLEFAQKFNKPVLPFIWHRYHNATERVGFYCINPEEFSKQVKQIAVASLGKRRVDGVVWWQEDMYYYNIKEPQFIKEAAGRSMAKYLDDTILKYLNIIQNALKN